VPDGQNKPEKTQSDAVKKRYRHAVGFI